MKLLPSIGQLKNGSRNINNSRCRNFFPSLTLNGKSDIVLYPTPGCRKTTTTQNAEVRNMHAWDGVNYIVAGDKFYKSSFTAASATYIGDVNTSSGHAWMTHNANNQLLIVDGSYGYVYDRSDGSFGQISDVDFPIGVTSCTFLNQSAFVTYGELGLFAYSALNDFTSWSSLDFLSAESNPDAAKAIIADQQELVVFGSETIEFYYSTGDSTAPYARRDNALQEIGIWTAATLSRANSLLFWLDDNLQPRIMGGYDSIIIADDEILSEIKNSADQNTKGFAFIDQGHIFYCLSLADRSLVYDHTTSQKLKVPVWHERASYPVASKNKWRANCAVRYNGDTYVGDYENGNIYRLDEDYYQDNGKTLKREASFIVAQTQDRRRLFHNRLEVEFEAGVGLATGQGSDPQAMMQYSDDGGHTYSTERWRSMGKIGEYGHRSTWRSLGNSRNREYVVAITDPVKTVIIGAHLMVGQGYE